MNRDIDLSLLRTFFTIAVSGSFTAASHQLFRTQPAISLRLKRLEDIIGFPLIRRGTDGVSLTREGHLVLGYAKRILTLHDDLMHRVASDNFAEVVRVGLPEEYTVIGLESVLRDFAMDYPSACLTIDVKTSGELDNWLREGRLDLIVNTSLADMDGNRSGRRVPVAWIAGERMPPSRHGGIRLVLPSEGNLYRRMALSALTQGDATWEIACTAANWDATRSAVLAGIGISVAPLDMMTPGMRLAGREDGLPPLPEMWMSLVCRTRPSSLAVRRLTELLGKSLIAGDISATQWSA